jgi:hypothetical protein
MQCSLSRRMEFSQNTRQRKLRLACGWIFVIFQNCTEIKTVALHRYLTWAKADRLLKNSNEIPAMKMKSIFFLFFPIPIMVILSACSGNKNEGSESHAGHQPDASKSTVPEASAPQFEAPQDFQVQLGNVFAKYTALKDALVDSNPDKVKSEAGSTSQAVGQVDMKLLTGRAHGEWMAHLNAINNALKEIENNSDIEGQREAFSILSDNLYKSIKAFGLGGKEAFYEFCPMAFNNEGAYWLSDSEQIRNPYFGDKMLTCGVVKEKLQ